MRRALVIASCLAVASCSQASGPVAGPVAVGSPTPAAAAPGAAPAASSQSSWEDDISVPREPFSDPEKNFEAARKALLAGYYRDSITEADLYRAAVAGMLERTDPALRKWNK